MVSRGGDIRLGLRVDWDSLIGDISNISVVVVGGILDMLGAAIGKSNIVRSRNNTSSISSLGSIEVSLGVVISNSILVGVGFVNGSWLNISSVSWGISRGGMDNWGMMDSMGNWVGNKSMVSNWVGNNAMVGNWVGNKSMVGNWVSYNTMVSSMAAMRDNSTMSMADHMG